MAADYSRSVPEMPCPCVDDADAAGGKGLRKRSTSDWLRRRPADEVDPKVMISVSSFVRGDAAALRAASTG